MGYEEVSREIPAPSAKIELPATLLSYGETTADFRRPCLRLGLIMFGTLGCCLSVRGRGRSCSLNYEPKFSKSEGCGFPGCMTSHHLGFVKPVKLKFLAASNCKAFPKFTSGWKERRASDSCDKNIILAKSWVVIENCPQARYWSFASPNSLPMRSKLAKTVSTLLQRRPCLNRN